MIISAAARTSDASILPPLFTLRGTFLWHIVTAILGKWRGEAVEQIIIRWVCLQKQKGSTQNIKGEKGKNLWMAS